MFILLFIFPPTHMIMIDLLITGKAACCKVIVHRYIRTEDIIQRA
jgi:hypothetical protein